MQYTNLHSPWVRLAMLLGAGFVVVLPAADLVPISVFEPRVLGDRRTTAYTAGVTWDPPRPGTRTSNPDGLAAMQKRRSARRRPGSLRRALRTTLPHGRGWHEPLNIKR